MKEFAYKLALILSAVLWASPPTVESARILAIFAFPGKSHFMMTKSLVTELSMRGHEVTFITGNKFDSSNLKNFTQIAIEPEYDFWKDVQADFGSTNIFELTSMRLQDFLQMLLIIGKTTTEHALKQKKVQEIINDPDTSKYDLLIVEQFYQEAFLALGYKFNIPVIAMSTLGYENHMSQQFGVMTPFSFVPHGFLPFDDHMNFYERLQNTFYSLYEDLHREFIYFPIQDDLVNKYFSHLQIQIPSVSQMEKNLSAILLNSHAPLTTTRPTVPGMIPVGGMHIKQVPDPLPEDIKMFIENSKDGVIYFSLGSNVKSSEMPKESRQIFLDVFSTLKQRVIWKFEDENIPELPSNVMVKKWLPQPDILAHPNVKVFITHGGLFGTQEGVYNAVPMLGMPFYCDQHLNMKKAVKSGYAISMKFQDITRENLNHSLQELLYNPYYKRQVTKVSNIFRDRPIAAMDTAMYWVHYIIRHKGAAFNKSSGLDLKWYEYYLLDVILLFSVSIIIIMFVVFKALKIFCNLILKNRKIKTN